VEQDAFDGERTGEGLAILSFNIFSHALRFMTMLTFIELAVVK
jgi:hypothetical protein